MKTLNRNQLLISLSVFVVFALPRLSYAQWQQANGGVLLGTHITNFALNGDKLFAGGTGDLINLVLCRTADYGTSWVQSDSGILPPDSLWMSEMIGSLASLDGKLLASCSRGLYRSVDEGVTWGRISLQPRGLQTDGGLLWGFGSDKNYRSSDYGSTWDSTAVIPFPLTNGVYGKARLVKGSLMLAAFQSPDTGYLFRSTDSGNTWFRVLNGLPKTVFGILSFARTDLFIFAAGRAGTETMMLKSSDNGQTWLPASAGLPADNAVNSCYAYRNVLFAGTGSWTRYCGVFISTDNGESWEDINTGLASNNPILSFTVCGPYLFAGTSYGGVWRRPLSEMILPILTNVKVLLEGPYNTITNEMNISLNSNGVLVEHFGANIPANAVDSICIEIRDSATAATATVRKYAPAWLLRDGTIRDFMDTTLNYLKFDVAAGNYFIVLHHRNHLAIMSSGSQTLTNGAPPVYDFTTSQSQGWGENPMREVAPGRFAMYAGDANASGIVTTLDANGVFEALLTAGYDPNDINLSGVVSTADANIVFTNLLIGSQVNRPGQIRKETVSPVSKKSARPTGNGK